MARSPQKSPKQASGITVTTNSDSIRLKLLIKVIDKALLKSIECLNPETLIACYPSFNTKQGIKYINNAISQINTFFLENSRKEIEAIFAERDVANKLVKLDQLIKEAQTAMESGDQRKKLHVESLSKQYLSEFSVYRAKMEYLGQLESRLEAVASENRVLMGQFSGALAEAQELVGELGQSAQDLEAMGSADTANWEAYFESLGARELGT